MKSGWSLVSLWLLLLVIPLTSRASGLIDPFYERFVVGDITAEVAVDGTGWPADLFTPAGVDSLATVNWPRLLASETEQPQDLLSWRIFEISPLSTDILDTRERLAVEGLSAWSDGRYEEARRAVIAILDALAADGPDSRIFVWSLRRRAIESKLGRAPAADEGFWPEMLKLGSFDRQTGWAIWSAYRRAREQPLLPQSETTATSARWLSTIRDSGLIGRDLDRSAYAEELRAGLGASIFKSTQLRRHFGQYPEAPQAAAFQEMWLSGKWRLAGHSRAKAKEFGESARLTKTNRADFLRRAAEREALAGEFSHALATFRTARALAEDAKARSILGRIDLEIERAAILADHRGESGIGAALLALRAGSPSKASTGRLADLEARVIAGESPDIDGAHTPEAAETVQDRYRRHLLRRWAAWGQALGLGSGDDGREALARIVGAPDPTVLDLAAAEIGARLGEGPIAEATQAWALWQDLSTICANRLPALPSPVPDLLDDRAASTREAVRMRHTLLGFSILFGDGRGQMAATLSLDGASLSADDYLMFMHPVPRQMGLSTLIREAGLEPELVLALTRNESRFDPAARSRAGALGWMQVMPLHFPGNGWHQGEAIWRHPEVAMGKGLDLLRENMRRYQNDPYRVMAAYNAGPSAVRRWETQLGGEVDRALFLGWIGYPETRNYVRKVLIDRMIYAWILDFLTPEASLGDSTGS